MQVQIFIWNKVKNKQPKQNFRHEYDHLDKEQM